MANKLVDKRVKLYYIKLHKGYRATMAKNLLSNTETKTLTQLSKQGDLTMEKALHEMSMKDLLTLHNKHADTKAKKFPSKAVAVRRTAEVLKAKGVPFPKPEADKKKRKRKASGPPKETRAGNARKLFDNKKVVTVAELEKATGWDKKNVVLLMGRLKNRKNSALITEYNSEKGTFTRKDG